MLLNTNYQKLKIVLFLSIGLIIGYSISSIRKTVEIRDIKDNRDSLVIMLYNEKIDKIQDSLEYEQIIQQAQDKIYSDK